MAWTLAKIVEQNTTHVSKNPEFYVYMAVFGAFFAGFDLRGLILMVRQHSATALDYSACPSLLLLALVYSYSLVRAIRRSRNGPPPSIG